MDGSLRSRSNNNNNNNNRSDGDDDDDDDDDIEKGQWVHEGKKRRIKCGKMGWETWPKCKSMEAGFFFGQWSGEYEHGPSALLKDAFKGVET